MRCVLPARRLCQSVDIRVGRTDVKLSFGYDENGDLKELFIDSHKVGSELREMMATTAMLVSSGLQHGTPITAIVGMLRHMQAGSVSTAIAELLNDPSIQRWEHTGRH